ncbi:MAG: GNAT family N-acetyltransferase [Candidatus Eremiobacteraeota bacterium]|nr:GNAT family N-acetyltransferase [Candidatus Eremiobacteraeota bacterium]
METDRLRLREPDDADGEVLRDYFRRNAARFGAWEPVVSDTAADIKGWIAAKRADRHNGRPSCFIAFDRGTGSLAGMVSLNGFSSQAEASAMLSYSVDGAFERRGYATEAVRRVIAYAVEDLGLRSLSAYYHPDNARSARLLERLGFSIVAYTPVVPGFEHMIRPLVVAVLSGAPGRCI